MSGVRFLISAGEVDILRNSCGATIATLPRDVIGMALSEKGKRGKRKREPSPRNTMVRFYSITTIFFNITS